MSSVSAGFDAAEGDELGGCNVTPTAYAHMTYMLSSLAGGKVVVALEVRDVSSVTSRSNVTDWVKGGYNFDAISDSALAVTQSLLGESPPEVVPVPASEIATEVVRQVRRAHSKYWKCINEPTVDVPEGGSLFRIPLSRRQQLTFTVTEIDGEPATINLVEVLKAHRSYYMFEKYNVQTFPLAFDDLEVAFHQQVLCT